MLREILNFAGESCFTLFVQEVRRRCPLLDDGLLRLNQLLVRWVTHVLAAVEIYNDRFHTLEHNAGPATALRTLRLVGILTLVLPSEKPTSSICGDSLVAHQLCEVLSRKVHLIPQFSNYVLSSSSDALPNVRALHRTNGTCDHCFVAWCWLVLRSSL